MRFLTNPMTSVRYKGKPSSRKRFHAAGFSRNPRRRASRPTKRQLAARKKFAAMARARAAAGHNPRARSHSAGGGMARRKRRAVARRSSPRRRRHAASRRRRVYASNPRRRVRRKAVHRRKVRRFRHNPGMGGILGQTKDLFVGAGVGLVGMAAGRTISNMIPFNASTPAQQPIFDFAKGVVVAVAIRVLGGKVIGRDYARIAAIGAMLVPTKNLIISYAPGAQNFLGAHDGGVMAMPRFTSARRIQAYPGGVASYAGGGEGMSAYSESYPN